MRIGSLSNTAALLAIFFSTPSCTAQDNESSTPLVSSAGDLSIIPGWRMHSTRNLSATTEELSQPGYDSSSWYRVSARGTVFAGLLENGVYNETELFYSDNLEKMVDYSLFQDPWLYREEFNLNPQQGQHYFLQTNGITSRAQIHINGQMVASETTQVGAYGGLKYDITDVVKPGPNVLLIKAFPTNYLRDFAMGYVDWNPYPPDNGTGVWRYVEVLQTGPVSISTPRVKTDFEYPWQRAVTVTIKANVTNHAAQAFNASITATIQSPDPSQSLTTTQPVTLQPGDQLTVPLVLTLQNPQIWWPASWGSQPLYHVNTTVTLTETHTLSDNSSSQFGIRHISSHVNAHNDTAFLVNNHPFLVLGAGYTSDIFYRFDPSRTKRQFQNVLDMHLNTIRLEGKQEHPEFYALADEMGLMIMPGWECCDKWEGWTYNDEADGVKWTDVDYGTAQKSMLHEAAMMQSHPSVLAFLVGSDFWPDDRATAIYVRALQDMDWPNPIVASAAKRGYPELLGPSGMKMDGPYDWVSPNYWYASGGTLGAAGGFGSELGSGVGTPERSSLKRFLSEDDMQDLWRHPKKGVYHMSTNVSSFYTRELYNGGLWGRYGAPRDLESYLWRAQLMDFEAVRAQFEAYAARRSSERPSTGLIYWMLQGAWPNLHWQLFDYYGEGAGAYYGAKVGSRGEHVVYDYEGREVWVVSHMWNSTGTRNVTMELMSLNGTAVAHKSVVVDAVPNGSQSVGKVPGLDRIQGVAFLRLVLRNGDADVLSRNVYWLTPKNDVLDWDNSDWYYTPVTEYANMTALFKMQNASVTVIAGNVAEAGGDGMSQTNLTLENTASVPAFFVKMNLVRQGMGGQKESEDVTPAWWEDNYVTLWPGEKLDVGVRWESGSVGGSGAPAVEVTGVNVPGQEVTIRR